MPLTPASSQAFRDALAIINRARFVAESAADRARLDDEERRLFAARRQEIRGDFAARTFYFNVIAERLGAIDAALTGDPYRDLKQQIQTRLLGLRRLLTDAAIDFMGDVDRRLVTGDPDEVHEDTRAVLAAPAGKTASFAQDRDPPVAAERPNAGATAALAGAGAASAVRADLRRDYETAFAECVIRPDRQGSVNWHLQMLESHRARYEAAGVPHGIPWWFIGGVHMLESGFIFNRHLHNGDPLSARTVRVPVGRPERGGPAYTWEESAADALAFKELDRWSDWSVAGALYQWERYNGFGYRHHHPEVASPYLWSFSNHYAKGKYVADGRFDPEAVSQQCGAATLLRALVNQGLVSVA
jgi:lysozyme family protein